MTMENQLEAERTKLTMMVALTNPHINDAGQYREWSSSVNKTWTKYLSLQFGLETSEADEHEIKMREAYNLMKKRPTPKIQKREKGKGYEVAGLDYLRDIL